MTNTPKMAKSSHFDREQAIRQMEDIIRRMEDKNIITTPRLDSAFVVTRSAPSTTGAPSAGPPPSSPTGTTNGEIMAYKYKVGDRIRHKTERWDGTITHLGMNNTASSSMQPSGYCVKRDDGVVNGGIPEGYNIETSNIELISTAAPAKGGVDFDSVILAADKKAQIISAISQIDNHNLIFNEWGFGDVFEKGTAVSLLFYGPPGTGKTLMAQAIADKYNYTLQVVSTAEIETPEPGGAERNLKKYFKEAADGATVLLFDECDSLISNRTHVGMILAAQINALLTELEHFTGIAIFTTNRLEALDPAFDRRLSLKLEFPMPDEAHRIKIWKRMFPKKAPLAKDIRWDDLAKIEVAGGHIKNVVLKAARLSASLGAKEITDEIIWECLEKEIESRDDMQDAITNRGGFFGTPLPNAGRGVDLARMRGKRSA
jgi:ATPase family associated with various cellular activities (AAA)